MIEHPQRVHHDVESSVYPTFPYTFYSSRLDPVTKQQVELVIEVPFTLHEMDAIARARELQCGENSPIVKGALTGSGIERDYLTDLRLPWAHTLIDRKTALQRMREASEYAADALQHIGNPELRQAFEGIIELVNPLVNPEILPA